MRRHISALLAIVHCTLAGSAVHASACLPDKSAKPVPHVLLSPDASYVTPDGRVRVIGYNDMAEMLKPMAARFTEQHPHIRFEFILKGTRTAPPALRDGTSLFAPMGAEWEDAQLEAYRARHGQDPVMFRVAHDSLNPAALSSPTAVIVNAKNPLKQITLDQIRAIFTGTAPIRAWQEIDPRMVGEVRPVGFAEHTAIGQFLRRNKFEGQAFGPKYVGKPQSRDVVAAVAADEQAIGFANLNHVNSSVRALGIVSSPGKAPAFGTADEIRAGRYPFDRHLLVYVRRSTSGEIEPLAKAWLELMLSCEGQAIIGDGRLGYIPLSADEVATERLKLN